MKRFKKTMQALIGIMLMMALGLVCGIVMVQFVKNNMADRDLVDQILALIVLFLAMYAGMGLQIIVHEGGHLVFGLLTGYTFSSFRIGSTMLLKENGKIVRRKFTLAGTGGQCLMAPPQLKGDRMPVFWYNMGGSIMNLLLSALSYLCSRHFAEIPLLSGALLIVALVGVGFALINGVPMRLGTVDNDGHNALALLRDRRAVQAFWAQLKMNEQIARGVRPKDMPDEWFETPEDGLSNPMIAAIAVMRASRLIDMHDFAAAEAEIDRLLQNDRGVIGLQRVQLVCEKMYCELIGACRSDVIDTLYTKNQEKMMRAMKTMPSTIRVEYAFDLLLERDEEAAQGRLAAFEKIAKTYPYPADIESERELIAIARAKFEALPPQESETD